MKRRATFASGAAPEHFQGKRGIYVGTATSSGSWLALDAVETPAEPHDAELGEEAWASEHAGQVEEALPGGLKVVGVFSLGRPEPSGRLLAFARSACPAVPEPVVVSLDGKNLTRYQYVASGTSFSPAEHAVDAGLVESFVLLRARARVNLVQDLGDDTERAIRTAYGEGAACLSDGTRVLNGYSAEQLQRVLEDRALDSAVLLLPVAHGSAASGRPRARPAALIGDVMLLCSVKRDAGLGEVVQALREDLVRTLLVRLDQVMDAEPPAGGGVPLPVRVVGPAGKAGTLWSGYISGDEAAESAVEQIEALAPGECCGDDFRALERLPPTADVRSPKDPGASAVPRTPGAPGTAMEPRSGLTLVVAALSGAVLLLGIVLALLISNRQTRTL